MGLSPQEKSDNRRQLGNASGSNTAATDNVLLALCSMFQGSSENTQSTMALGIFETTTQKIVLIGLQTGSFVNEHALPVKSPKYGDYKILIVGDRVPPAPGLHAEMMVIRDLMLAGVLDPEDVAGSASKINLRIVCPEKKVCPDCAGYLRKHGIPHYPVDAGDASPNWVNPRTGACFRVTKKGVGYYNKEGGTQVGDPVNANAGNLGPISRIKKG